MRSDSPKPARRSDPLTSFTYLSLAARGILGGFDLAADYPELGDALLVCATETKTAADIERYRAYLGEALQAVRAA